MIWDIGKGDTPTLEMAVTGSPSLPFSSLNAVLNLLKAFHFIFNLSLVHKHNQNLFLQNK